MYHIVGYTGFTFGVTNFDLVPLQDAILTIQNNHYLPQVPLNLYGGWFGATDLSAVILVTPKSRQIVPPRLYPIQGASLPPDRPHIFDRRNNPFTLNAVEEVSIQANVGGAANERINAVMMWGTSIDPVPIGDVYTYHGVSTTAAVANAWTQIAVIYDQTIPAGLYAVIGSQHQSTNAVAHRMIFKDQVWRPGFLSQGSLQNISEPSYYYGGWGKLGQFTTVTVPNIEVWCTAADNAHDFLMNIVRIG